MKQQFDLIAIGTGSAVSSTASQCRAAGWNLAIFDSRSFGGTCAERAARRFPQGNDLRISDERVGSRLQALMPASMRRYLWRMVSGARVSSSGSTINFHETGTAVGI
jgi:hypothetical protein